MKGEGGVITMIEAHTPPYMLCNTAQHYNLSTTHTTTSTPQSVHAMQTP
jgi:hypothetical protein